jgi:hypothetical protein
MASVRSRASASLARFDADPLDWLRRLHVIALLGDDLATFYRPASRITQGGVRPGALYTTASRVEGTGATRLILAGPRVGVGFAGGERYHHLLARSAGDEGATQPARALDVSGVPWGGVLWGRAPDDSADAAWYCPPRPLTDAHFDLLFAAYRAALDAVERGLVPETLSSLARFHYRFVRLHPFRCCNQSLAMNLVNEALTRALGAGIPHLLLDQLALRFSEAAYERLFALAATGYAVKGQPAERWRIQRDKKARAYALIERLKQATDTEAEAIAFGDSEAARAALILV